MKIIDVLFTKSFTGFYFDDQRAIKKGAKTDGNFILGDPITPGFTKVRQAGEAISIQLILEDGSIAYGDCAAVQYSGVGGRDPLFLADEYMPFLNKEVKPLLIGLDVSTFRENATHFDHLKINGKSLHTAIRYGLSQAFLYATAITKKRTMAEVIRKEYNMVSDVYESIPVFTQSGDDRYNNADKMIIKRVGVISHGLFNNVEEKFGLQGELMIDYINWLKARVASVGDEHYKPIFHLDTYGSVGIAFNNNMDKMIEYLLKVEKVAHPHLIRIEGPVDLDTKEETMECIKEMTRRLKEAGSTLEIVVDEWCNTLEDVKYFVDNNAGHMIQIKTPDLGSLTNTIEAILYCVEKGVSAYCGGTCNETNISAEATMNVAIATHASQVLGKPGMGVDEAFMICRNEINRVIELANNRKSINQKIAG